MTGAAARPPTAEASAPSMPATTTITSAAWRTGSSASSRWIPATPTSVSLGESLAQRPVVVDPGEAQVGEGEPAETFEGGGGRGAPAGDVFEELPQAGVGHGVT